MWIRSNEILLNENGIGRSLVKRFKKVWPEINIL